MDRHRFSDLRDAAKNQSAQQFRTAHACDWLVWDMATWHPAKRRDDPTSASIGKLGGLAALMCVPLALPSGRSECVLGRAAGCDISINDQTLSARHLAFTKDAHGWRVKDLKSSNGSVLDGARLAPNVAAPLADGTDILAGDVHFTFRTSEGLYEALRG